MSSQISTFKGVLILSVVALFAAIAMLLSRYAHDPYGELQTRNLVLADRYVRAITPILEQDTRFREVGVHAFTGADGSVVIDGRVASDADFADLKRVIEVSRPQITALVSIKVDGEDRMRIFELRYEGHKK